MADVAGLEGTVPERDQRIADVVGGEGSRLRNFIRRRVADPGDAEDVLQDVFSELVEANRLLMPIEHLTGWLFTVARNRITDLGPDAVYERGVMLDAIEDALDELPPEQREVFLAHELEGRSFKEMAAETGVGINTLLSRKRYAVLHLRERLRDVYEDFVKGKE
jgi:DNA-directed RNA polymerase specialized sigma24 family protein